MTGKNDEWEDSPQVEQDKSKDSAPGGRPRGTKPVALVTDNPEKAIVTSKPKINWTQLLLAVILGAVLAGAFVIKWAPSKADVNILRTDMQEAVDTIASRNGTIDNLVTSMGELRMKVDLWSNADYVTESSLTSALGGYVSSSEFSAFQSTVAAELNSSPPQEAGPLGLETTYESGNLIFTVSKADNTSTAYFTIEGTVYYNASVPATPTPTPSLAGFDKTYSAAGMDKFTMTTYARTESGGTKNYVFTAPLGTWYYKFDILPLDIGGDTTSGSTW